MKKNQTKFPSKDNIIKGTVTIGIFGNTSKPVVSRLLKFITDILDKNKPEYLIEKDLAEFSKYL